MDKKIKKTNKIIKFGGSSVGSAERIKNVCKIINQAAKKDRVAVVVSAMQGVTDKLLALDFDWVKEKHLTTAKELKTQPPIELLNELEKVVRGINLIGDISPMALDLVASFGERLSAELIACYMKSKAIMVDARGLIRTDSNFQNASVDFTKTNVNIKKFFSKQTIANYQLPIITGFVSSNDKGQTTTLGRGGSDYTAAIFGAALGVDSIEIWTDVNGVMSADPRIVQEAKVLPQISYEEAFEMAYFGAKVIYPNTMLPAIRKSIPVVIKNTFHPNFAGTVIGKRSKADGSSVKNISSIDNISLINIGGANLAGVPGTAERVFKAVADKKVNVILISQASSEHTICFAVKKSETEKTIMALKSEFNNEIRNSKVNIERKDNLSIIAVVGENMRGVPGIAGKLFSALGNNKINILAIAQGSSEKNISLVVNQDDKNNAISRIHKEFFSEAGKSGIFLIGTGVVGSELLKQLATFKNLKVCAVANSKEMYFYKDGRKINEPMDLEKYLERAILTPVKTKILVDCTASEIIAKNYLKFVRMGFHIVTPNKKFNVLPMKQYKLLRKCLDESNRHFYYDANVGADLPVIETLKKLIATGDKIKKIEGIFSGTLSYLFNNFYPVKSSKIINKVSGKRFSELVKEAQQLGYTEPDPREDLNGKDVGRKLLILAREMGWPLEFNDVRLESLSDYSDEYFTNRFKKATTKKCVLRYVGTISNGKLSAKLKEISLLDPLANVSGTDNVIAIYSKNYKNPLVIKGPGAGAEVTAAAVLNGILRIIA